MSSTVRMGLRWLAAVVLHAIVFFILFAVLSDSFVANIPDEVIPRGIKVDDFRSNVLSNTRNYFVVGCVISFALYIFWNILFAVPGIKLQASKLVKPFFFISIIVCLVSLIVYFILYVNASEMTVWASWFSGAMNFYFLNFLYLIPFLVSLIFCSPYVIKDFKYW